MLSCRWIAVACVTALAGCGGTAANTATNAVTARGHLARGATRPHPAALHVRAAPIGRLPAPLQDPATTRAGAGARAIGGLDAVTASVADVLAVDAGGRATVAGRLDAAVHDAAAATIGATTYLFGGGDGGTTSDRILAVAPGGSHQAGTLPRQASDVSATAVGGTAYVVGGYDGARPLDTIVAWQPGGRAHVVARLPHAARYAAVAAVGGKVLIAGGTPGTGALDDVVAFDPATRRVKRIGRLPVPISHAAGATLGGAMLVVGGRDRAGGQLRSILTVDPATGRVRDAGALPQPLSDMGAASLPGRVLLVGGRDSAGHATSAVLALTPVSPSATPTTSRGPARNVYGAAAPQAFSAATRGALARVYVPETRGNAVDVIDQRTFKVLRRFRVPAEPQHVTPSYDLRTLWVDSDQGNTLTPIDPRTGRNGKPIPVADPYNLYFTPDGRRAIVVAERLQRLDFRDPHTMRLLHSAHARCPGLNHMDFTADGRRALVSCEFSARMAVLDVAGERIVKYIALRPGSMPQDVRLSPDGRTFYVADMMSNGLWVVDAATMRVRRFMHTGAGAHGLVMSRDARRLFVANRGEGSISVLDLASGRLVDRWQLHPGGSPDMGGISADGQVLWLSGRYDREVYAISTRTGRLLHRIPVGDGPHGLSVWPQPGRFSLGHTGTLR
ncbi:MAG: hypothetical protein QOH62_2040 [Solirubrobacteraceae bacterium]|nr:hypothetical protein [Solirubrobacteraceae bacterium]